ncbi:LCP family protein [Lederbergia galactosidilytica]|uniref:LCP family glycopolymer transferase n=1 Tax=Lederbergia galactosidilytica TaxID=217031 RepID=UPI0007DB25A0|nr:LCP family protein required for cell wall assembly [Lederbergia galactosidilytica]
MRANKTKQKKRKKILWGILSVFFIAVIGVGIYVANLYFSFTSALDNMHEKVEKSDKRVEEVSIANNDPFSVLLLGIDDEDSDVGRSDTMIVATVNPKLNTIKMLSIPRDTRTEIVGNGTTEKINHAYARGGVEMSIATVEHFLDIPIDYYVEVNMDGFTGIIDAFDGVTVKNDMDLTYKKHHFPEGEITMNGKEALIFSRIRYEDPRGDFGRQVRQKQIIQAILNKARSLSSLLKYDDVLNELGDQVKTNFSFKEMVSLQQQYKGIEKNIEQYQFENFDGGYIGKYWYFFPDKEEVQKYQTLLKEHLELTDASLVNNEGATYTVQANDTLTSIAQKLGVTEDDLVNWNHLSDPNSLQVGQTLSIEAPIEKGLQEETDQQTDSGTGQAELDSSDSNHIQNEESSNE